MNNDKQPSNGYAPAQAISQQERELIEQQLPKSLVNGSSISQKEQVPSPTAEAAPKPAKEGRGKLWEPKYSALGFVLIVLTVLVIDVLPRLIRSKLDAATTPKPVELNELQSLLVAQLDSLASDFSEAKRTDAS